MRLLEDFDKIFQWKIVISVLILHTISEGQSSWRSGNDLGQLYDNVTPNPTGSLSGPYFVENQGQNVIGIKGKTSNIGCSIKNLGNLTVSWIRHDDTHLLTTGMYRYTPDQRFSSLHKPSSEHWVLEIRNTEDQDQGVYECQISTTPVRSLRFNLEVVDSFTTIPGSSVRHVDVGSVLNLTCLVVNFPLKLDYIIFYHNDKQINPQTGPYKMSPTWRQGMSNNYTSSIVVMSSLVSQSGQYHCAANPGQSQHVTVHVHHGENPAGLQLNDASSVVEGFSAYYFTIWVAILNIR